MPRMALKEEWHLLTARYSDDLNLRELLWQEIEYAYTDGCRHYHQLRHLSELLSLAGTHRTSIRENDSLRFAIYYHDIVYSPLKCDNEERSADLAVIKLQSLGLGQKQLEHIRNMILATKTHGDTQDTDTRLLLDFDLSILGQPWEKYYTYTQQIRKEYSIIPYFLYKKGRKKVLKHFLAMPAIYKTTLFQRLYESTAKANLERELQMLK